MAAVKVGRMFTNETIILFCIVKIFFALSRPLIAIFIVFQSKNRLSDVFEQFVQSVEMFQNFFDVMDQIDSATFVIEPDNPSRNVTYRRIALGCFSLSAISLVLPIVLYCIKQLVTRNSSVSEITNHGHRFTMSQCSR